MNLRRHLRQRVLWKHRTGADRYNTPTYAAAVEIPARVEEKIRVGASGPGETILATTGIIVEAGVRIGDLVATDLSTIDPETVTAESPDGEPYFEEVEARESYVDRRGVVRGYKCYLEPVTRS